ARFLTEEERGLSLLWGVGICFMVGTLLLTTTRSAWVGLVAGLVVLGWSFGLRGLPWRRIGGLGAAFALTLLLLVLPLQGSGALQIAWQKGVGAFGFNQGSVGGRLLWWQVTGRMIQDRPVLGMGTGQFSSAYPAFQRRFGGETAEGSSLISYTRGDLTVESPHNQLLHTAAELGLPGVVLLLWLVLILIQLGLRGRQPPNREGSMQVGAAAGLVSLMVHGLFAYPLQTAPGVLLFSLLAGLILACGNVVSPRPAWWEAGGEPAPGRRRDVVVTAVLTVIAVVHFGLLIPVYTSSLLLHRGTEFLLRREPGQAVVVLEGAARVSPRDPQVQVALGKSYAALGRFQEAAAAAEAGKRGIDSPELRRFLAGLYIDLGLPDKAEAEYREGMGTWPGYAPLRAGYGALLARQGRYEAALRALQRAKELDPVFADTYHYLGHLYWELGQHGKAIAALREYLRRASSHAAWREMDLGLIRSLEETRRERLPRS
ncbi:MAG: O-antigen ligase family protein, partial [Dehalococcoidia bacterium]